MIINSSDRALTIGTSVQVVSENQVIGRSERVRLVLTNVSTGGQTISISTSGEAVASQGLVLSPGGHVAWDKKSPISIIQSRVTAIADLAGGSLAIHEEVLQ